MTPDNDQKGRGARWIGVLIGLAAMASPTALLAANAADQLYERTLMTAADGRCRLFSPTVSAALDAARAQARGASLRSGVCGAAGRGPGTARARAEAAGAACNSTTGRQPRGSRVRRLFADAEHDLSRRCRVLEGESESRRLFPSGACRGPPASGPTARCSA
ncbi:hypothetical protein ACRAWD_02905 [Caulobacter segnis]